ncbi:hypothetical protein Dtox_1306 [Desulfofarcimen acetoxidans DSM 771]|uniref:Uncharacterized protein n=1 Tax=Desulfofarcimen acetoxidans (strain ATCC 49208 / DSM 771 / KCTC 5769 / VKM B-1644 / 5575) TaxID=485916 RepID=C8W699_DESAS|nr:hypothetical protein Dtox_1306 [Desulfofarcimen acetoxidans DSM 771]
MVRRLRISSRFFGKYCLHLLKKILLYIAVPLSPLIVWFILVINRNLLQYLACSPWLKYYFPSVSSILREDVVKENFIYYFNSAALSGLLTLFGVIVTVWYYYSTRQQELIERKFFVIDELIAELKKNRRMIEQIKARLELTEDLNQDNPEIKIYTDAWHKLGADVALLPRRMHMRLSVLYGCLAECKKPMDYCSRKQTLDKIAGLITDMHKYRTYLGKKEVY